MFRRRKVVLPTDAYERLLARLVDAEARAARAEAALDQPRTIEAEHPTDDPPEHRRTRDPSLRATMGATSIALAFALALAAETSAFGPSRSTFLHLGAVVFAIGGFMTLGDVLSVPRGLQVTAFVGLTVLLVAFAATAVSQAVG